MDTTQEDVFELRVGLRKGQPVVELITPGKTVLNLGRYPTSKKADKAMRQFEEQLEQGYRVREKDPRTAELLPPEKPETEQ